MIVCISGPSCTGKTTVARILTASWGIPLRSCGDEVRGRADELGVAIPAVPDEHHREIDRRTIEWALGAGRCIVEGRFLDAVMAGVAGSVVVSLTASREARTERGRRRSNIFEVDDLVRSDAEDETFRARMYGGVEASFDRSVIDTSELAPEECARRIAWYLQRLREPPI